MTVVKPNFKAMEENKTQEKKKLSYEELSQACADLSAQNQQMMAEIRRLHAALNDSDFNKMSFFVSMLFKVVEHPEMYDDEFTKWCVANIEGAMRGFVAAPEQKEEKKDEAE